jgi:ribosomal protein S24E
MSQQDKQREIARLESDLNLYKRERDLLQQQTENKRKELMDQMRSSTSTQRNVVIINQIGQLNNEYGRKKTEIDAKIYQTRLIYFKKLSE